MITDLSPGSIAFGIVRQIDRQRWWRSHRSLRPAERRTGLDCTTGCTSFWWPFWFGELRMSGSKGWSVSSVFGSVLHLAWYGAQSWRDNAYLARRGTQCSGKRPTFYTDACDTRRMSCPSSRGSRDRLRGRFPMSWRLGTTSGFWTIWGASNLYAPNLTTWQRPPGQSVCTAWNWAHWPHSPPSNYPSIALSFQTDFAVSPYCSSKTFAPITCQSWLWREPCCSPFVSGPWNWSQPSLASNQTCSSKMAAIAATPWPSASPFPSSGYCSSTPTALWPSCSSWLAHFAFVAWSWGWRPRWATCWATSRDCAPISSWECPDLAPEAWPCREVWSKSFQQAHRIARCSRPPGTPDMWGTSQSTVCLLLRACADREMHLDLESERSATASPTAFSSPPVSWLFASPLSIWGCPEKPGQSTSLFRSFCCQWAALSYFCLYWASVSVDSWDSVLRARYAYWITSIWSLDLWGPYFLLCCRHRRCLRSSSPGRKRASRPQRNLLSKFTYIDHRSQRPRSSSYAAPICLVCKLRSLYLDRQM